MCDEKPLAHRQEWDLAAMISQIAQDLLIPFPKMPTSEHPEFSEKGKVISEGFDPMTAEDVEELLRQLAAILKEATEYMSFLLRRQGLDLH
jgi:hypothetical protein